MLARIQAQIKHGALAAMQSDTTSYLLGIQSGDTAWKYRFARGDFSLQENSRWTKGKQVELTRYTDLRVNTGLKTDYFKF